MRRRFMTLAVALVRRQQPSKPEPRLVLRYPRSPTIKATPTPSTVRTGLTWTDVAGRRAPRTAWTTTRPGGAVSTTGRGSLLTKPIWSTCRRCMPFTCIRPGQRRASPRSPPCSRQTPDRPATCCTTSAGTFDGTGARVRRAATAFPRPRHCSTSPCSRAAITRSSSRLIASSPSSRTSFRPRASSLNSTRSTSCGSMQGR